MEENDIATAATPSKPIIAGFWRRVAAILIDFSMLGLGGLISGIFLFDSYAQMGPSGRFFGFAIALGYFGLLNSEVFDGQTIGKRLLHIMVVDKNNRHLTLGRSIARFSVLGIPYFLNNAPLPHMFEHGLGLVFVSVLVFGAGSMIVYLAVFNRRTRQSLHDLALGSFVVSTVTVSPDERPKIWRGHHVAAAIILVISLLLPVVSLTLTSTPWFEGIRTTLDSIEAQSDVRYASMVVGSSSVVSSKNGRSSTTYIAVRVVADRRLDACPDLPDRCARVVVDTYPDAAVKDTLRVIVSYGFDIGIASSWRNNVKNYRPSEWPEAETNPS